CRPRGGVGGCFPRVLVTNPGSTPTRSRGASPNAPGAPRFPVANPGERGWGPATVALLGVFGPANKNAGRCAQRPACPSLVPRRPYLSFLSVSFDEASTLMAVSLSPSLVVTLSL